MDTTFANDLWTKNIFSLKNRWWLSLETQIYLNIVSKFIKQKKEKEKEKEKEKGCDLYVTLYNYILSHSYFIRLMWQYSLVLNFIFIFKQGLIQRHINIATSA
jgi:hypothetical protein